MGITDDLIALLFICWSNGCLSFDEDIHMEVLFSYYGFISTKCEVFAICKKVYQKFIRDEYAW